MLGDPYFSIDGLFSLPIFYILQKNEGNLLSRSFNFGVVFGLAVWLLKMPL